MTGVQTCALPISPSYSLPSNLSGKTQELLGRPSYSIYEKMNSASIGGSPISVIVTGNTVMGDNDPTIDRMGTSIVNRLRGLGVTT